MRVLHVSHADSEAGAARAAFRLHTALRKGGIDSEMRVAVKMTGDAYVSAPESKSGRGVALVRPNIGQFVCKLQRTDHRSLRSVSLLPSGLDRKINESRVDLVNLHWVCGELLSIEEIGRIRRPLVWTVHDMWPFTGTEHVASYEGGARWEEGYTKSNRPEGDTGVDLDRWTYRRKLRAWRSSMHIVAPSRWLADCVRRSALMKGWPVHTIPNALDTARYKPYEREFARDVLGLPLGPRLLLFTSLEPDNHNKGFDLLQSALARLANGGLRNAECVVLGQAEPRNKPDLRVPVRWLGRFRDDASLALAYSAADVVVVPSRQENLPQVATEAQACGAPVVAFDAAGLPDAVEHMATGYLARPFDPEDLAAGIAHMLCDLSGSRRLRERARERAVKLWSQEAVAAQYERVYLQVTGGGAHL